MLSLQDHDEYDGSKPERRSARGAAAAARKVTPQRKQNNRKAQQRYREKRKAQAAELELKVALLTTELDNMKAVQGQATQLQEENAKLRAALGKQQETLSALKVGRCCRFLSPPVRVIESAFSSAVLWLAWLPAQHAQRTRDCCNAALAGQGSVFL